MALTALLIIVIAALLAVVFMLWSRLRKLEQAPATHRTAATSSAGSPLVPLPPMPSVEPVARAPGAVSENADEPYDPDRTKIHIRPPLASAHAVLRHREGATPLAGSGAHLVGLSGHLKGRRFAIVPAGITVGRHQSCEVIIPDPRVSAHHAWIGFVDGKPMLRDLESTNGTFLNTHGDESVSEAELIPGDTIIFGSHQGDQFRFALD